MDNSVQLIGVYGSDETHALSAWTSTSKELTQEKKDRIPQLLKQLAKGSDGNSHMTPFEKSSLHFLVTAEVASHIHLLKHRVGVSINSESARYKELKEDKYYLPVDWSLEELGMLEAHCYVCFQRYHQTLERLVNNGTDRKRAKESARYYLPYATQLQFDIMFNFSSFIHFLKLRNKLSAQLEIRLIADSMLTLVRETGKFTYSLEAFNY